MRDRPRIRGVSVGHLDRLDRPVRTYRDEATTCAVPGCSTKLSRYNAARVCWLHRERAEEYPLPPEPGLEPIAKRKRIYDVSRLQDHAKVAVALYGPWVTPDYPADALRYCIHYHGWTMTDLATRMGLSRTAISNYSNRRRRINHRIPDHICDAINRVLREEGAIEDTDANEARVGAS
jgi:antitoxin component HigA of HigAB toxin-antitoxin module